ncbi:MAG TPA: glycosyltransferase family 2 protein [Patescibacteria group bacterium]|nr:glycosyltransferase family 2 protein [Patescibacteria group bacterium]
MKLVGVAMVKNEADIIEAFVRHNLGLLDRLLIIDHQSSDATVAILDALRAEGLPIDLMRDTAIAFRQGDRIGELARQAFNRHQADHVFALDADEFIVAPSRDILASRLDGIAGGGHASLPWRNFVPEDAPPAATHPFARIRLAARADVPPMTKLVLGRAFVERDEAISHGNHALLDRVDGEWLPLTVPPTVPGLTLAHLPFRSIEQFIAKIVLAWFGNRLLQGPAARHSDTNWHWRDLFDRYVTGETPTWSQMREHALRCYLMTPDPQLPTLPLDRAQLELDPIEIRHELRYTPRDAVDPMRRLSVWVEQLLDRQMTAVPSAR